MTDNKTPKKEKLEATHEELKILRQLRKNPIMGMQIKAIMQKFEDEIANGMDANEAEASLIESLQQLGKSMMSQWAENTQQDTLDQAKEEMPSLQKHAKKTPLEYHLRINIHTAASDARRQKR